MADRFAGVPRGKPLRGPKAIARTIWEDESRWRSVYLLDRDAYGIKLVAGELLGFENWIQVALAADTNRRRSRKPTKNLAAGVTNSTDPNRPQAAHVWRTRGEPINEAASED